MADVVRCPMCSKPNPAGADTCQHCQARLKPLIAPAQSDATSPALPDSQASSDWLGDLRSGEDGAFQSEAGDSFEGGEDDWVSRLGQDETPAAESKPDWLAAPVEKGDPNVPDWMEELGVSKPTNTPTDQDDWSQRLQASEPSGMTSDQDDLKNWLADLSTDKDVPVADSGGMPDWLSAFSGDEPSTAPSPEPAGVEPTSALPDWLTTPDSLPKSSNETEPDSSASELPDWLSGLDAPDLGAPAEETEQPDTFPAWLNEVVNGGNETQFEPPITSEREPPTQPVPDWLNQFEQIATTGEALPDQMAAPGEETRAESIQPPKAFPTGSLDTGDLTAPGSTPDWLSGFGDLSLPDSGTADVSAEPAVTMDWLSGLGDLSDSSLQETPSETTGGSSAFVIDGDTWGENSQDFEMPALEAAPDWLSSVTAPEANPEEQAVTIEQEGADEATLAELPTWLESMRPVGSAVPSQVFRDEADSRVESAGPLSGLRGVLQAEPEIANFRKPPVYINKLQVTEAHQAHIALLEELVAAEGKPKPVQPFVPIRSQIGLRLLIAISLIAAIFFGLLWDNAQQVPLPGDELPLEIKNLRGSIESLPPNAPVLVAVDYEAGSAAEMNYPARLVLQNLEQKQAFITFASTSLNGPMLSQLLLRDLDAQSGITYTNYTVLGYIPGGASGLLSFARAPRQTLPGAFDGAGWQSLPLIPVHLLPDFALVVVMTDNADTARLWIEQVRPQLDTDTPLLMVLSAQAEPMTRPYFQQSLDPDAPRDPSQVQLSGYIAGMAGAAAYQSKLNPQVVWKEWDALAMASLVAFVVIALGGMFNLGLAISSRPKSKK